MAKRPIHPMPDDVRDALGQKRAISAYRKRPAYQRNDHLGWIDQAKTDETRRKRIDQMIDELRRGDVYMKMAWRAAH